jgi:drug/metabolite transporter (DMT)-like permease
MFAFITVMGWWRHATQFTWRGRSLPRPTRWTFLSGVCTSAIIATTTLAYTFEGISIVFMMLLLRGGVLILAPVIDTLSGRRVRWFSLIGLLLSIAALLVAFLEDKDQGFGISQLAMIDVAVYLLSYFIRLQFMSRLAKSDDADQRTRYFVEEQMVATTVLLLCFVVAALVDSGEFTHRLRAGFTSFLSRPASIVATAIVIGLCSQGTGIFGGLILLDKRENTYCVPVNRCSSILAGVAASYLGMALFSGKPPSSYELAGAGLIVAAILVLTLPLLRRRKV